MRFALFTLPYLRFSLEKAFSDAKRLGFDGIEVWGGRPHTYAPDMGEEGAKAISKLAASYGLPLIGYTPEMNAYPYNMMLGTEEMRRDSVSYVKLCIDVASKMGAGFVTVSAGHAGYEASRVHFWRRLIMSLREIASHAEDVGVDIILEPLTQFESNVVVTCDDLVVTLDEVGSPRLLGMCDVVPPFCNREPIMGYFDKLGPRMRHIHLVDSDGQSEAHMMPGDGRIPLRQLLREIEAIGYTGYCTIELISAIMGEPSLGSAKAIERLRGLLK